MFLVRGLFWLQRNLLRVLRWCFGLALMVGAVCLFVGGSARMEEPVTTADFVVLGCMAGVVLAMGLYIALGPELRLWLDRRFLRRLGIEGKAIVMRSKAPTKEKWIVQFSAEQAVFEQVRSGVRIEVQAARAMEMVLLPQFVGQRRRICLVQQWQTIEFGRPGPSYAVLRDWRWRSMARSTPGALSSLFWEGVGYTVFGVVGFAVAMWGSMQVSAFLIEHGIPFTVIATGFGVVALTLVGQGLMKLGTYYTVLRAVAAGD